MKIYIIFILLTFSTLILSAANPEADFKKVIKKYTLHQDGSLEMTNYKEIKLNTHVAFNKLYGETFITYNPKFQQLKIDTSYTIQADGTIIIAPSNAFNEVLPAEAANAPAFNGLKEMVVTHTGLEIGATIFLKYTLLTKPGYNNELDINEILQETSPVKNYTIIIDIPVEKELKYSLSGYYDEKPIITEKNGSKLYSWNLKNVPASSRESNLPQAKNNSPYLIAVTYASQKEPLEAMMNNISLPFNEVGKNFTTDLVKNDKTLKDKIMTIQQYVVNQITTSPVRPELTGYKMRSPYEVLNSSYGTEWEKTSLLFHMLKAINTEPELTVTYPGSTRGIIKGLKAINGLMVKVNNTNGSPLFLSATTWPSETPELRGERDELWLISQQGIRPLNVIGNTGKISYEAKIKIDTLKAITSANLNLEGGIVPIMSQKETEAYLNKLILSAGKSLSSKINSVETHHTNLYFSAEQSIDNQYNYIIYDLPVVHKGCKTWGMEMLYPSRENIYEIPYPIKENYEYELELSPELTLKTKEFETEIKNSVGSIYLAIIKNENKIKIYRRLEINKSLITPNEYTDFKKIIMPWINPNTNQILLHTEK